MAPNVQNNILSQLIREVVNENVAFDSNSEVMIIIDGRGNAYTKKPAGIKFFMAYRYFIVNTIKTIAFNDYLCTLQHSTGRSNINIEYRMRCLPADAEMLAVKFFASQATLNLNSILQQTIESFDKKSLLAVDFTTQKQQAEAALSARAKEYGLTSLLMDIQMEGFGAVSKPQTVDIAMFKAALKGGGPKAILGIAAEISITPGQEAKASNKTLPPEVAEEIILTITKGYLSENVTPQLLYDGYNSSIKYEIEKKTNDYLDQYGRVLKELSITLRKQGKLDSIIIATTGYLDIRVKESHQVLKLKYRCELVADPAAHSLVHLFAANTSELEELIADKIKATLAEKISIEEFSDALNTSVSTKLALALNETVAPWGRRVGYLQLENDRELPPKDVEIKHTVNCTTKDGYPVSVNNTLLLQRDYNSHKVFEASQVKDFDDWGKKELDRITKNFIINHTYNQLLFDMQDKALRELMQKEAEKIGYTVNQLITLPEFEGIPKTERFNIDYENTNLASKADGVPLAVSLHIEGRITNYTKIIEMLAPKASLASSMDKTVDSRIKQFARSVEPERFFNRFYTKDTGQGDSMSLEDEISQIVKAVLSETYEAEIREITVNRLDTPLILRLKQLQAGVFTCEFNDREAHFRFMSRISVLNVDPMGWHIFHGKRYRPRDEDPEDTERTAIARHISDFMANALNTSLIPKVNRGQIDSMEVLLVDINDMLDKVKEEIKNFFGLEINIFPPVKIEVTDDTGVITREDQIERKKMQLAASRALLEMSLKQQEARLHQLYAQRREKEANNYLANSPEMKRINDEIEKIEKLILKGPEPVKETSALSKLMGDDNIQDIEIDEPANKSKLLENNQ